MGEDAEPGPVIDLPPWDPFFQVLVAEAPGCALPISALRIGNCGREACHALGNGSSALVGLVIVVLIGVLYVIVTTYDFNKFKPTIIQAVARPPAGS